MLKIEMEMDIYRGICCQKLPDIPSTSMVGENNALLSPPTTYSICGVGQMILQKKIRCCHEWLLESWRLETAKVSYILGNFSYSLKLENSGIFKHTKKISTRKSPLYGRICQILFSMFNQFIVTTGTCNVDGNLYKMFLHQK